MKLPPATVAAVERVSTDGGRVVTIDLETGTLLSWPELAAQYERQEVVRLPQTKARSWAEVLCDLVLGPA